MTIYKAGSNYTTPGGTAFGGLTLSGNGAISLTGPATGPYAGITIFQARDNTRALSLAGNGAVAFNNGVIYATSALVSVGGNAQLQKASLIVNQLQLTGNGASDLQAEGSGATSNSAGQFTVKLFAAAARSTVRSRSLLTVCAWPGSDSATAPGA